MFDWFHKALPRNTFTFASEGFVSWKKRVISTLVCLSLVFQEKMWLIERGLGGQEGNKKG